MWQFLTLHLRGYMSTDFSQGSPFTDIYFLFYLIICDPCMHRLSRSLKLITYVWSGDGWLQGRLCAISAFKLCAFPSVKTLQSHSVCRLRGQVGIPVLGPALLASHMLAFAFTCLQCTRRSCDWYAESQTQRGSSSSLTFAECAARSNMEILVIWLP